jgi:crossover junction endodeoxyribonuclease RuvC
VAGRERFEGACHGHTTLTPAPSARGGVRARAQNPSSMIVLGIDPGLANTGYGVVARDGARLRALDGGVVTTPAGLPLERRLERIATRIRELLGEHACDSMALEQLYFGANAQSAFAVGHARGVAMLAAGEHGVPCASYTPQQVKAAVCGSGRAAKDQVARMVQTLLALPTPPAPDHASDALAVAVCHLNGTPLADAVARAGAEARTSRPVAELARYPVAGRA